MAIKISRQNISEHLLEYQLSQIGKTVKDAIEVGNWRNHWTSYNKSHADKFRSYAIPLIKKVFRCNRKRAESTLDWFLLNFGLNIYH